MNPLFFYRIGNFAWRHRIPLLPWLMRKLLFLVCHADIPMQCKLGRGVTFGHFGLGVVIHDKTVVGDNCVIYHGVTIGRACGVNDNAESAAALARITIGPNTLIGAHAIILAKRGDFMIGARCAIGAGAVVIDDMADDCIAVGNPAKITRREQHGPSKSQAIQRLRTCPQETLRQRGQ